MGRKKRSVIGKRFRDYRTPPGPTDICGVAMVGPGGHWWHTGWHRVNPEISQIGSK